MPETIGHCQHCSGACFQVGKQVICGTCGTKTFERNFAPCPSPDELETLKFQMKQEKFGHLMKNSDLILISNFSTSDLR